MTKNAREVLAPTEEKTVAKSTVKASIVTDLFSDKRYLLLLYRVFHPEDTEMTEAQSTWTMNIIVRVLMYLAQIWHDYLKKAGQNFL